VEKADDCPLPFPTAKFWEVWNGETQVFCGHNNIQND
jgi:hypothetical protein